MQLWSTRIVRAVGLSVTGLSVAQALLQAVEPLLVVVELAEQVIELLLRLRPRRPGQFADALAHRAVLRVHAQVSLAQLLDRFVHDRSITGAAQNSVDNGGRVADVG